MRGSFLAKCSVLSNCSCVIDATQSRDHSYELIVKAIKRATAGAFAANAPLLQPMNEQDGAAASKLHKSPAESNTSNDALPSLEAQLRAAILETYTGSSTAFQALSKSGSITKKGWKKCLPQLLPSLGEDEKKKLRKKLRRVQNAESFAEFVDGASATTDKASSFNRAEGNTGTVGLAALPVEVPQLPATFKQREHPQQQLIAALLESGGKSSGTSVTAPRSKVSSVSPLACSCLSTHIMPGL